jgi:tRNA(Ile)-lysidine synthase
LLLDPVCVARFSSDLQALIGTDEIVGIAVSGGPDSLALLLLAHAARTGRVSAATVDHGLRAESAADARFVADVCEKLQVPHQILHLNWSAPPQSAVQAKARHARYDALGEWARAAGGACVLTGHHADDQAETLLMRLARGAGVRGLAAIRPLSRVPGHPAIKLVRPLLGWRKSELEAVCASGSVKPLRDPSNGNEEFERVRTRAYLDQAEWLDAAALARTARSLAEADCAIEWATQTEWKAAVESGHEEVKYRPAAPAEIQRRVLIRILDQLATEGSGEPRGEEVGRLLETLRTGGSATLRGVSCVGGTSWRFTPAPARKG